MAGRTNDSAGDGTTTASVLARELIKYGLQAVTSGSNPISIKKGIDKTCDFLVGKLKEFAKPVKGSEDIRVSGRTGSNSATAMAHHCPAVVVLVQCMSNQASSSHPTLMLSWT